MMNQPTTEIARNQRGETIPKYERYYLAVSRLGDTPWKVWACEKTKAEAAKYLKSFTGWENKIISIELPI